MQLPDEVYAELLTAGLVVLPAMTREELFTLEEAGSSPLRDVAELTWWNGLDTDQRELVRDVARRALVAHGLVAAGTGDDGEGGTTEGVLVPAVAAALATRSNPLWLAVAAERGEAPAPGLRISAPDAPWVLVERVAEGIHAFAAARLDVAARHVAEWLTGRSRFDRPPSRIAAELAPEPALRTLEVMRSVPGGEGPARSRLAVARGGGGLALCEVGADGEIGGSRPADLADIEAAVQALFAS